MPRKASRSLRGCPWRHVFGETQLSIPGEAVAWFAGFRCRRPRRSTLPNATGLSRAGTGILLTSETYQLYSRARGHARRLALSIHLQLFLQFLKFRTLFLFVGGTTDVETGDGLCSPHLSPCRRRGAGVRSRKFDPANGGVCPFEWDDARGFYGLTYAEPVDKPPWGRGECDLGQRRLFNHGDRFRGRELEQRCQRFAWYCDGLELRDHRGGQSGLVSRIAGVRPVLDADFHIRCHRLLHDRLQHDAFRRRDIRCTGL